MKRPKVSVVIPTYNRLELLKKAVDSVFKQSFIEYELIISDNCSQDGTKKWTRDLAKKNSKVRYFRNKKNLGMIANWNKGLSSACGEYISLLMDDDLWHPEFLKETVKILDKKKNVGLVGVFNTPVILSKKINRPIYPRDFYRLYNKSREVKGIDCIRQYIYADWLVGLPSAVLVRKECFDKLGSVAKLGLDPEIWLRVCSKYDFYYLDKELCFYGAHNEECFSSKNRNFLYRVYFRSYCKYKIISLVFNYSFKKADLKKIFPCFLPEFFLKKDNGFVKLRLIARFYGLIVIILIDIHTLFKIKLNQLLK